MNCPRICKELLSILRLKRRNKSQQKRIEKGNEQLMKLKISLDRDRSLRNSEWGRRLFLNDWSLIQNRRRIDSKNLLTSISKRMKLNYKKNVHSLLRVKADLDQTLKIDQNSDLNDSSTTHKFYSNSNPNRIYFLKLPKKQLNLNKIKQEDDKEI